MNQSIIYRLENQYNQIDNLIESLPVDFLRKRHEPGKWSIREHLAHLGRYQEIFVERINRIIEEDTPRFERYTAEDDEQFQNWTKEESTAIVRKTKEERTRIVKTISQLNEQIIHKTGTHPKFGNMTIINWTEFFLLHESHHIYAIFRLIHGNS